MSAPAIEIQALSAGYRDTLVLREISSTIAAGEIVGILGPNGAGKSTLFRCLTGLLRPVAGTVRIFGHDAFSLSAPERARLVAVVPQEVETPMAFTVEEVVGMGRTAARSRWAGAPMARDRQAVERALAYTDTADLRHRPLSSLSGGEKQRALVALALAQEPRLILMDEATSHLDLNHRLEILQLVERLQSEQGLTVVMISHDLQLAAEFCHRLLLLDRGRLMADGAPAAVLTEEHIKRVYHCAVRVQSDPQSGALHLLPTPRLPNGGAVGRGVHVHVVAGGGCGEETLRRLALCGYTLSVGVLNQGDLDAEVADALGARLALEKPFSHVSSAALAAAQALSKQAAAVVLSPAPFGPGNLPNLDLLEAAQVAGQQVFICDGIEARDYTPGHTAIARVKALLAAGAIPWHTPTDLTERLREKATVSSKQ